MKKALKLLSLLLAVFAVACDTQEPEPKPEPEPTPTEGAVTMTDIEIVEIIDVAVYFSVTVRNMDSYGYIAVPSSEYSEVDADYVIKNSFFRPYDLENTSWEEDLVIALTADTEPETEYVLVVAAKNSTSSIVKTATVTTTKQEMVVEKQRFNPTSIKVISVAPDYYLTMSTALYEMKIHLVGGDTFGGRYDNCDDDSVQGFVAEGSSFKALDMDENWVEYGALDTTIGNIDFYENVVTGKWETFGSFCFAVPGEENSWLTLEIEIPEGKDIDGITRTEPYEFVWPLSDRDGNIIPISAEAVKSADNANVWNLTVTNNKDNTMTFTIDLGKEMAYIPSGTYTAENGLDGCSMIVNNVRSTLSSTYNNKVVVDYDEATEETTISVDIMVAAGTAVVKVNNAGPYKLYEEVVDTAETFTEGEGVNSILAWTSWDPSGYWDIFLSGVHIHMQLYFMTGTNASEHLPAGRYYLRSSAPSDGSLWIDGSRSYAQPDGTRNQFAFACDTEDAYIDVTAEYNQEGEFWGHDMTGTLRTANGAYIIHLNFVQANNDRIY